MVHGARQALWVSAPAVVVLALVSGCGPVAVPDDPRGATLSADVTADGDVDVALSLGGDRSESDLLRLGRAVGAALLPEAPVATVDANGAGSPFVVLHGDGAFRPGPGPVIDWDSAAALDVLRRSGFTHIALDLSTPAVPTTVQWNVPPSESYRARWSWEDVPSDAAPEARLELSPQPGPGVAGPAVGLLGVALAVFGLRRRRRVWGVAGGIAATAALLAVLVAGGFMQIDNLAVRGHVSGAALRVMYALPAMTFPAAIAAWVLLGLTKTDGERVSRE